MEKELSKIIQAIKDFKTRKDIKDLKERIKKLEEKDKPKTIIEHEFDELKKWLYE